MPRNGGITVRIEGMERLRARLREVGEQLDIEVKRALRESAEAVRDQTSRTVRVDTGNLRDKVDVRYKDEGWTAEVGWWERSEWYARVHEMGTSRIPAQPSLGPALEEERARFQERLREAVRRALR